VQPGINGEVVPIRDARALAEAALKWWERLRKGESIGGFDELKERLSFNVFEKNFIAHLDCLGIKSPQSTPNR
jgi:hypothetical protein